MARGYKDHTGTVLSGSLETLLTFSSGLLTGGAVVQAIQLTNAGGTDRVVTVYLIPSGQVAAPLYILWRGTVPANDSLPVPGGPWQGSSAAFIQALQDAGTDVTARVTAFEES